MNTLTEMGARAKTASRSGELRDGARRTAALTNIASALEENAESILKANAEDLRLGREAGLSEALLDRLALNDTRIAGIAEGVRAVAAMPDPIGRVLSETVRPNGLRIEKVSVALGVIAVIFEARPNVSADSAALCLKSGSAVILRGGKEAYRSNAVIVDLMRAAIEKAGLPADCIQLVSDLTHRSAQDLMTLNGYVDVLIPRGGPRLIRAVVEGASVPTIETGAGTCHVYVDRAADIDMAAEIIYNAKTSRPSVCNACECMLIHEDVAAKALPVIAERLKAKNVEIRGDEATRAILPFAKSATEDDWGREYGDFIIACRVVKDEDEAIAHVTKYGTGHSECIVTADDRAARRFMDEIDAAAVYHNASTRFTDGGEFGLGAEIGISTQKIHARGPLGINELCSYKYRIYGEGQVR